MNFLDYQDNTKRTCPSLGSRQLDNAHMIYGMVSEIEELHTAIFKYDSVNIGEEVTDGMWYLSNYCRMNNVNVSFWEADYKGKISGNHLISLTLYTSILADFEKKELAYKKPFDLEQKGVICWNIWNTYMQLYQQYNLSPSNCMQNNIDKLMKRYPDKFNTESALNRNLDVERKELEK